MNRNNVRAIAWMATGVAAIAGSAMAQPRVLLTDRTGDSIYLLSDDNNDFVIQPNEVHLWFSAANAAGTPSPLNPNTIAVRRDGLVIEGDQDSGRRLWVWMKDLNGDLDALDEGESGVLCDATNLGAFSFAFPTGADFDAQGRPVLINAGNGFGSDSVFIGNDLNNDGKYNDTGEITNYCLVNGFGAGNGAYSPQEVLAFPDGALLLRNSSTNLHGLFWLRDSDLSGTINSTGEFVMFYGAGNASGINVTAGFDLSRDPVRERAYYLMHTQTGSVNQIVRVQDLNNDGDAMDADEARILYQTNESNYTPVDTIALADGSLLMSDNASANIRIIRFTDLDNDGAFTSAGERANYFVAAGTPVLQARSMAFYPISGCNLADIVSIGGIAMTDGQLTVDDIIDFVNSFSDGTGCPGFGPCNRADVTGIGGPPAKGDGQLTVDDIIAFFNAFSDGCPGA